jgi:hypothetical protein
LVKSRTYAATALMRLYHNYPTDLERAEGQTCRRPPFGALDQFLDESSYCITTAGVQGGPFSPDAGVEIEPDGRVDEEVTPLAPTVYARAYRAIEPGDLRRLKNPQSSDSNITRFSTSAVKLQ